MAITGQTVTAEKSIRIREKILIEGTLKVPAELSDMASVLDMTGLAEVNSLECREGGMRVTGTARYSVVYVDKMGRIMAFDAECTVDELVKREDIPEGVNALAELQVGEVTFRMLDSRSVSVRSNIELTASTHSEERFELAKTIDEDGVQLLKREVELPGLVCVKNMNAYIKSEVKLPTSMPPAERILLCRGYARVDMVVTELERIIIEGTLNIHIVYLSEDGNSPIQCYRHSLPYSEVIHESECSSEATAVCRSRLIRLGIEMSEEPATLEIGAVIALNCRCRVSRKVDVICDVYACGKKCTPEIVTLDRPSTTLYEPGKRLISLPLQIPATGPEVERVLYAGASFSVLNTVYDRDRVFVNGMASVNICYMAKDVGIKNYSAQLPFETDISISGMDPAGEIEIWADLENISAEGVGRDLELKANVEFHAEEISNKVIEAVSGAEFYPAEDEGSGIVVFCADGSESMWQIAKRFSARADTIGQLNDLVGDVPEKGSKLILIKN